MLQVLRSLITRKRTFLEKEEWKTTPWAKYPETKTAIYYLQDILCDFPGFCEDRLDLDAAVARGEDVSLERHTLESKLISAVQELVRWRWQWDAENPGVAYEKLVDTTSLSFDYDGPLFDSVLYFNTLEQATDIILYNTTLQMLAHFYQDFARSCIFEPALSIWPISTRPLPTNPLILPSESLQFDDTRSELCRCIEYHLLGVHASSGAFALMFPLRVW